MNAANLCQDFEYIVLNVQRVSKFYHSLIKCLMMLGREGYRNLYVFPNKLSRAKAVQRLANLRIDRELRIHEIEEDEEMAEILYKEVYGHESEQEIQQQLKLRKQKQKLQKQQNLAAKRAWKQVQSMLGQLQSWRMSTHSVIV